MQSDESHLVKSEKTTTTRFQVERSRFPRWIKINTTVEGQKIDVVSADSPKEFFH